MKGLGSPLLRGRLDPPETNKRRSRRSSSVPYTVHGGRPGLSRMIRGTFQTGIKGGRKGRHSRGSVPVTGPSGRTRSLIVHSTPEENTNHKKSWREIILPTLRLRVFERWPLYTERPWLRLSLEWSSFEGTKEDEGGWPFTLQTRSARDLKSTRRRSVPGISMIVAQDGGWSVPITVGLSDSVSVVTGTD